MQNNWKSVKKHNQHNNARSSHITRVTFFIIFHGNDDASKAPHEFPLAKTEHAITHTLQRLLLPYFSTSTLFSSASKLAENYRYYFAQQRVILI